MYIERDTEFNLLYINFSNEVKKGVVAKTTEAMPGVYLDTDSDGKLLGIEIFSTKEVLGILAEDLTISGELITVEEVADYFDRDRDGFLEDIASRPDFPQPVARLESGHLWLSGEIEDYEWTEVSFLGLEDRGARKIA